jgi:hypothetical protein
MALFTVQPGHSFHAVQEVYASDKPRLSISGWFHGTTPPPGAENASIAQLKTASTRSRSIEHLRPAKPPDSDSAPAKVGQKRIAPELDGPEDSNCNIRERYDSGFVPLKHATQDCSTKLSSDERLLLEAWINPLYLQRGSIGSMVSQWEKASCVQLHGFLKKDVATKVCMLHR